MDARLGWDITDYATDNVFRDPIGRFADIEEDEAPLHLLASDYPRMLDGSAA